MFGIPKSTSGDVFHNWAQLPVSREEFSRELKEVTGPNFRNCEPLPGAERLLSRLSRAYSIISSSSSSSGSSTSTETKVPIELALASATKRETYELKTSNPATRHLLSFIPPERRVLGGDPRIGVGRTKPAPDAYLIALEALNATRSLDVAGGEKPITPGECLVFEDSIIGVEAGRRAGMRVIWVPHPDLAAVYRPKEKEVLAGRTAMIDIGDHWQLGHIDDGWAESISSLEHFDFEKYGLQVPCS
jgi:pseudouridine 5'-phosphatase